jgi:hypothetical protein
MAFENNILRLLTVAGATGTFLDLMKTRSSGFGKTLAYILIALLAGLVIGNSNMKADLRHAREDVDRLTRELAKRGGGPAGLNGITSMLRLPETPKNEQPDSRRHRHPANTTIAVDAASPVNVSNAPVVATGTKTNRSSSMSEQLQTASELWKTRSDLARNNFVSNVTTSSDQAVQFDVAMAAMNLRLSNSIRTWVDSMKDAKEVSPEASIKILNDLSGALVWAYKDLDQSMPADWRTQAGAKFAVFDFINPDVDGMRPPPTPRARMCRRVRLYSHDPRLRACRFHRCLE